MSRLRDETAFGVDAAAALAAYLAQTRVVHVVRFGLDGRIQMVNPVMAEHLGLTDALPHRSIFEYLTEPGVALVRQRLTGASKSADPVNLNFCDAGGEPFTLSSHLTVSADGCLLIGEAVYADEQRLQRQLMELNEELAALARDRQRSVVAAQQARHLAENASRDKDDGLAVIAHELRQPLNTALAALGVVKLNPARAERAVESLGRQIGYMTRLVEDLLHASQVMRGTITLKTERVDLTQLVNEAAEFIEAAVRERRQRLTISGPEAPLPVRVDIGRMRQVLTNILSNATKYTPGGGSIMVTLERSGDAAVCVRVRDTGEGIAAEALGHVFDLFVRGTTGGNGLGIGLAVAKRLVELQDGSIIVRSEGAGRGSEFMVTLPLVPLTA